MKKLESEIVNLQVLADVKIDSRQAETLKSKKIYFREYACIKAKGALVRSRYQNLTEMDASSKKNFSLENKNGQCNSLFIV